MDSRLSAEVLKSHDASSKKSDPSAPSAGKSLASVLGRSDTRSIIEKQHSEAGSMSLSSGAAKMKLFRLRHKIKLFGGSFSKSGSEVHHTKQYENTYQLEPKDGSRFSTPRAEQIIRSVLEAYLKGKPYDHRKFSNLCKSLAELIKERVKATGVQRYKLVAHVMILENQGQSTRQVSRCLWNTANDGYATATYETKEFTAVGSIFASYYD